MSAEPALAIMEDAHLSEVAALAGLGHNNPPEPTPFDLSKQEIDDLYIEATNWLDGAGVQTQSDADEISRLMDLLRQASKRADERRVAENKPFDDGKAAVQAKYAPLIADTKAQKGKAVLALDTCKKALTPFLQKLDAEKRAKAELARKQADEQAAAAQAALRAAKSDDLEARAKAETALALAKAAESAANRAENEKAHAKGGTRAVGLRTSYRHELTDVRAFAAYVWQQHYDELCSFLDALAKRRVDAGCHAMPGVSVVEVKSL